MAKQKKNFKSMFENSVFSKGQFYIKLSLTILLIVVFLVVFVTQNGYKFFEHTPYAERFRGNSFQAHFINVENGDAILLKLPSNEIMMIDTGEEKYKKEVTSYVKQFLHSEGLNQIDYLVLTHSDSDHVGSAASILNQFKVVNLYRPKIYSPNEYEQMLTPQNYQISESLIYSKVIDEAYENNCNIYFNEAGIKLNFGSCTVEFLAPLHDNYSYTNNYSAVILITYQNRQILLMGDAPISVEEELIRIYETKLKADILKVGHHGSYTSTSQKFIDVVAPEYAILSCSGSEYFPHEDVLKILNDKSIKIYSTAVRGSFAMSIKDGNILVANAEISKNYLVIIFAFLLLLILLVWRNPFELLKHIQKNKT